MGHFLKGLIKLAAAGVKAREGKPAGTRSHARRAAELFEQAQAELPDGMAIYMGLDMTKLAEGARRVAEDPPQPSWSGSMPAVEIVFALALQPEDEPASDNN